jgi:hypothetical protein
MLRLGVLAGMLLLAGALPWITGGPQAVRLIAVPLLVTGVMMGAATASLRTAPLAGRAGRAGVAEPATAGPTCACGATAGCQAGSAAACVGRRDRPSTG